MRIILVLCVLVAGCSSTQLNKLGLLSDEDTHVTVSDDGKTCLGGYKLEDDVREEACTGALSKKQSELQRQRAAKDEQEKRDQINAYYGSDADLAVQYAKDFGGFPSKEVVAKLHAHGVNNIDELKKAEDDFSKHKALYGKPELTTYLGDRESAASRNISIAQAIQLRKREEERAQTLKEREEARERAEYQKQFPFEAVLTCGRVGPPLRACFVGPYGATTELELTNGSEYHMYQFADIDSAGKNTSDGFVVPLRKHFSLKAQNAFNYALLNLTVRDTKSGKILYQKSAAQFGVIYIRN